MSERKSDALAGWGPIYWHGLLYRTAMRLLRGSRRPAMYALLAREIGDLSTLDLCCGDGELRRWLSHGRYQGLDKNPVFIRSLRNRGVAAIEGDVLTTPWPEAECLVMVDSLYHFLPDVEGIMRRVAGFPAKKIIVSESIENLASSPDARIARFAAWATRVDGQSCPQRFSENTLSELFEKHGFQRPIKSGANLIGILER